MAIIRGVKLSDKAALYDVCVATGDSGNDATGHHPDHEMLGDVYVGPYLELAMDTSFALVDEKRHWCWLWFISYRHSYL